MMMIMILRCLYIINFSIILNYVLFSLVCIGGLTLMSIMNF